MKKITEIIDQRKSISLKKVSFFDYLPAVIANIFSVIFCASIIFELKGIVSGVALIILTVFIIWFLIMNEIIKVKEIRKVFAGNKNAIISSIITFVISIALASIGMWFFTNKSTEIQDNSNVDKTIQITQIENKYKSNYEEIINSSFEITKEFDNLNNEILYWKKQRAASIDERTQIRSKIDVLQLNLNKQRDLYNSNKNIQLEQIKNQIENEKSIVQAKFDSKMNKTKTNNFITYIFLTLIIIVEFATIILNKNIVEKRNVVENLANSKYAKLYLVASNILDTLFMTQKNGWVNITDAKKNNISTDWDEIKMIYNNFISLGILEHGEIRDIDGRKILFNKLALDETNAHDKLSEYYDRFFKYL